MANEYVELFKLLARTASENTPDQVNYGHKGLHIVVEVTSITATPSVVPTIEGKDPLSGVYYTILAGTAITDVTGTGTYVFKVYPGIGVVAGGAASDILPLIWRLNMVHGDADSITYSAATQLVD